MLDEAGLEALFEAIDAQDTERFVRFLSEDSTFRFGSAPAVRGRGAIAESVDAFFAAVAGLRHVVSQVLTEGDTLVAEGEVTYTRHDGSEITLPFANVFEFEDGSIAQYKVYCDIGPLFTAEGE